MSDTVRCQPLLKLYTFIKLNNMETSSYSEGYNEKVLHLNDFSTSYLREIAKWTKFLSILGFIGIAFMVIASFFVGAAMSTMPNLDLPTSAVLKWLLPAVYIVMAAIYALPIYYLYKFSVNTRAALDSDSSDALGEAFRFLKSHYKFIGIFMIIMICIYAVAIIGGIIIGVASLI